MDYDNFHQMVLGADLKPMKTRDIAKDLQINSRTGNFNPLAGDSASLSQNSSLRPVQVDFEGISGAIATPQTSQHSEEAKSRQEAESCVNFKEFAEAWTQAKTSGAEIKRFFEINSSDSLERVVRDFEAPLILRLVEASETFITKGELEKQSLLEFLQKNNPFSLKKKHLEK